MKKIFKKIIVFIITWQAKAVLAKYDPKIIAVTGSVGKTTTKDAIYIALRNDFNVRGSDKSFNSEIGIPLTILGLENKWTDPFGWLINIYKGFVLVFRKDNKYPEILVMEIGADRPGDIENVTKWLIPDIAVITRFGTVPVHVQYFESPQHIIREKSFLARNVKSTGTLILNADDENVLKMQKLTKAKVVTYAEDNKATVCATNARIEYEEDKPCGLSFKLEQAGRTIPVRLKKVLGKHHIYAGLAALAVGLELDINIVNLISSISDYRPPAGRLRLIDGVNDSLILDDSYNSSPVAMSAALDTLESIKVNGKKYVAVGDMLELGKFTKSEHKKLGEKISSIADEILLVGKYAEYFEEGLLSAGVSKDVIHTFENSSDIGDFLKSNLKSKDIVLVKGSQSMRMEKAIVIIMRHPENKESELVRQESEWLIR